MSQEEEQNQSFPSGTSLQRPLRDRVGIFIPATRAADAIIQIREAEQAGVRQIWGQSPGFADILTIFAAAATQTERIRLGTAIIPTYPRHPMELAQQATVVDDLAPGRLRLGIGPGTPMLIEDWYGLSQTSPLVHLKEYLEIVRGVLWERATAYHGTFFNVSNNNLLATMIAPRLPTAQIPLLISAVGPKAFRLAGEISDGALSYVSRPYARMFAQAGFPGVVDGNEAEIDALARTLVVSGNEATVSNRLKELLASGLHELLLQLVPVTSEASEREQLLHLVGSL